MPFPPTPSNTPSNTPTPSVTATVTPTITPSNTQCPDISPTPTTTITATPTITPSPTPCPCVCGAEIINNNDFSIDYSYTTCDDLTYSGTIAASATFVLTCVEPTIYVKYGSITTSASATITYGACITFPTPTPTATVTPTVTPVPTIYLSLCIPEVIPEDGNFNVCIYAQTTADCGGTRTNANSTIQLIGEIFAFVDGDWLSLGGGALGTLNNGENCSCQQITDSLPFYSGSALSATTSNVFPLSSATANYLIGNICYSASCVQCDVTPTPTPTQTSTPTPTPTICNTTDYLLFNETGSPLSWTALDCSNNEVGNTINGGQQANTGCVQTGTLNEGSLTIVSSTPC